MSDDARGAALPTDAGDATGVRGVLTGAPGGDERSVEDQLRPGQLSEMIGQDRLRENLAVFIEAAARRDEALDHLLFYGPPGLGKTSLARIVAREMQAQFKATSGPVLERAGDLAALLSNLDPGDVLFIDEIHRLPAAVEEILYPAMEDFQLDLLVGQGPAARSIRIDLPRFTLVGATTRAGLLTSPLRDRFGWSARLDYYPPDDLVGVLLRSAGLLGMKIAGDAAELIARRSRGTPRIANRLPAPRARLRVRTRGADAPIDAEVTRYGLERLDVDEAGFDKLDRILLGTLIEKFGGGPTGLETLAAAIGEDKGTLEDLIEPFLIQGGYLDRTPRGRVATPRAFAHFGIEPGRPRPPVDQGRLF